MGDKIQINLQEQPQEEVVVEQPKVETPQVNGMNQVELATLIATAIAQANKASNDNLWEKQQQKDVERQHKARFNSGSASKVFELAMKQEIKDNKFYDFPYLSSIAQTFGKSYSMSINGYTLTFLEGATTRIPQSLKAAVLERFSETSLSQFSKVKPNIQVVNNEGQKVSSQEQQDVLQTVTRGAIPV